MRAILRDICCENFTENCSSKYREKEEQKELIDTHVERKRKASACTTRQKEKEKRDEKPEIPDLLGIRILHKWVKEDRRMDIWRCT